MVERYIIPEWLKNKKNLPKGTIIRLMDDTEKITRYKVKESIVPSVF